MRAFDFINFTRTSIVGHRTRSILSGIGIAIGILTVTLLTAIGTGLHDYITAQRANRKVKTDLCEFYCLPCRKSRAPAAKMADCKIEGNKAKLTALCGVCEGIVCKPISLSDLPEVHAKLDLTITRVEVTL